MIVVMNPDVSQRQIELVVGKVEDHGLKALVTQGTRRTVICCLGDKSGVNMDALASIPGVEAVMPVSAPYKLASREVRPEPTLVALGDHFIGGDRVGVIAGPCTVEGRAQILDIAHFVKEQGACALRGGAFKPRTSPYTFQGLMEEGLEYLAMAGEETGLAVVTEVMSPEHVPLVVKYADALQIGTRNMQNFMLLSAVGEIEKPVLLKRGMASTIKELLLAAEYVMSGGNRNVILCERGIRTFESYTRFTLSLGAVPSLKELTHLPVAVDPSHGTGRMSLVRPMSRAAVAAGADALLIELHPEPENAILDGAQSVRFDEFTRLIGECRAVAGAIGREL